MMSRPQVLNGFHHYGQPPFDELLHQQHAQAHTHAHAHPGPMYRPHPVPSLSMRAPEHPAAGYNHQHTGHHGRTSTVPMSDPAYLAADDELAQLQKLSSEYEPETTVSARESCG
jgi:ubiquitin thioesterase protein OTUB1